MNLLRRRVLWIVLLLGAALASVGFGRGVVTGPQLPQVGAVPAAHDRVPAPAVRPAPVMNQATQPISQGAAAARPEGTPQRLRLPTLGVEAPVEPVMTRMDGELAVPSHPSVVGWWAASAAPGAQRGTVVVDGHVDTRREGPGALFHLAELRPGDPVRITTGTGTTVTYTINAVHSYPKASLPHRIFDRSGKPRLVLITCGGAFNQRTRQYADNIVAYATPVEKTEESHR